MESRILFKVEKPKRQVTFLGVVTEQRMQEILEDLHIMLVRIILGILGRDFATADHKYRVNTEIPAVFLAILLHVGVSKETAERLCSKVFHKGFLEDMTRI